MAGAIQTRIVGAKDPGLALVECGRDAGLEDTRVWHYCVRPHTIPHGPQIFLWAAFWLGQRRSSLP